MSCGLAALFAAGAVCLALLVEVPRQWVPPQSLLRQAAAGLCGTNYACPGLKIRMDIAKFLPRRRRHRIAPIKVDETLCRSKTTPWTWQLQVRSSRLLAPDSTFCIHFPCKLSAEPCIALGTSSDCVALADCVILFFSVFRSFCFLQAFANFLPLLPSFPSLVLAAEMAGCCFPYKRRVGATGTMGHSRSLEKVSESRTRVF